MSTPFYDLASLVVVPSGYKSGKVYAQKPQTTDGQLAFTRASSATRVASNGLIEKVRTNLITYSNDFSNAAWTKTNFTLTSGQSDPFGGSNAWKFECTSTSGGMLQTVAGSGVRAVSIYAKAGNVDTFSLWRGAIVSAAVSFNLTTGTIISGVGTITPVGGGWYRCSTFGDTAHINPFFNSPSNGDFIFLAFSQLENSDIATAYIPTTTAAVSVGPVSGLPRLDYLNSTCPKLLLEPQRTNLVTFSENFDNAAWTKSNSVVTANTSVSPDGYTNADTIVISATGYILQSFASYSAVSGQKIATSIFAKNQTNGFLTFGGATPAGTDVYAIESYGNGWYRHSVVRTFTTTTTGTIQYIIGTVGTHIIWGAQFEGSNSAYATSYIPTLAASVTRGADACSKTGISSLIGQTEGVVFVDYNYQPHTSAIEIVLSMQGATSASLLEMYHDTINRIVFGIYNGGSAQATFTTAAQPAGRYKIAFAYKANDFAMYLNGVQVHTDNSGSVPALSSLGLGFDIASSSFTLGQTMNQALLFKARLTNAQLSELTTI